MAGFWIFAMDRHRMSSAINNIGMEEEFIEKKVYSKEEEFIEKRKASG